MDNAEKLADRLGTHIPGDIPKVMWSLPLLDTLATRVETLEQAVLELSELVQRMMK